MGIFASRAKRGKQKAYPIHSREPYLGANSVVIDQFNITADKTKTVKALAAGVIGIENTIKGAGQNVQHLVAEWEDYKQLLESILKQVTGQTEEEREPEAEKVH